MKTIHIDLLDADSVKSAVAELREVKSDWEKKAKTAALEVCRELADQIRANFEYIPYTDDMINVKTHEVIREKELQGVGGWSITETQNGGTITVGGKDIVFVEFGAGAHYNHGGENPLSESVSFSTEIGSFGKGQGLNDYWFVAHNLISKGTPMYMPIYRAILAVKPEVPTIVRKVFV